MINKQYHTGYRLSPANVHTSYHMDTHSNHAAVHFWEKVDVNKVSRI